MNILLTRKVEIDVYEVIMDIGRQTKRDDLLSILKLADYLKKPLKPIDICENFFPEKPESIGEAILVRCRDLDLLDDDFKLTEIGKESLNASKVFLKEEYCYLLWITRDFLYPEKFLDIKSLEFNEKEMRLNYFINQNESKDGNQIIHTPEDIQNFKGKIFTLSNLKDKIVIYNIDEKLKKLELKEYPNLRVYLEIKDILENPFISINLSGFLNKKIEIIPDIEIAELWLSLLGNLSRFWNPIKKALKVNFSDLSNSEKRIFQKFIKINSPEIPNLGKFDSTMINDIRIIPKSKDDAQTWAEWLMVERITKYISKKQYEVIKKEIQKLFDDFEIIFPTVSELAKKILISNENKEKIFPQKYWFLQTPLDLNTKHIE